MAIHDDARPRPFRPEICPRGGYPEIAAGTVSRGKARKRPGPVPYADVPVWKRILLITSFALGGGAFTAWGVYALVAWCRALLAGDPIIETMSALLGIAPLGIGMIVIFLPALVPKASAWRERAVSVTMATLLVATFGGVLLATVGSLAVSATMRHNGYRDCETWYGTRMSITTWAARGVACPPPEE